MVIRGLNTFYQKQDFKIKLIMADGQFKGLATGLAENRIEINIASKQEHMPAIKRFQ